MAQQPPPPSAPSYTPGYSAQVATELAGFWRRLVAYVLDAIIIGVIGAVIGAIIGLITGNSDTTGTTIRGGVIGLVIQLIYFGYFWSRPDGQSIGYMALGIRLIRVDGSRISPALAALRALLIYLSFALCLVPAIISAFMIGLGRQKQAIHDVMVGTVVLRT